MSSVCSFFPVLLVTAGDMTALEMPSLFSTPNQREVKPVEVPTSVCQSSGEIPQHASNVLNSCPHSHMHLFGTAITLSVFQWAFSFESHGKHQRDSRTRPTRYGLVPLSLSPPLFSDLCWSLQ